MCLKTHTMEGPEVDPGVNLRALHELFRCVCVNVCVDLLVCMCVCSFACVCVCVSVCILRLTRWRGLKWPLVCSQGRCTSCLGGVCECGCGCGFACVWGGGGGACFLCLVMRRQMRVNGIGCVYSASCFGGRA